MEELSHRDLLNLQVTAGPSVPDVEVWYEHLSLDLPTSSSAGKTDASVLHKVPTVFPGMFEDVASGVAGLKNLGRSKKAAADAAPVVVPQSLRILDDVSGRLRPGTATLILAPPGHGSSSFLKALAGLLVPPKGSQLRGTIRYSGLTSEEAAAQGIAVKSKLCVLVGQADEHLPLLTVRETLDFACHNMNADPVLAATRDGETEPNPVLLHHAQPEVRVADTLRLLGLDECADTILGNDLLRGCSGGQRRRCTIAEQALVGAARVLLLDQISTGLDSAVTLDVLSKMKLWATITKGTMAAALLQPTPETFALFDDVILLREGAVIYHGPRTGLVSYFSRLGFVVPTLPSAASATSLRHAGPSDLADWLIEALTDPAGLLQRQQALNAGVEKPVSAASLDTAALSATWKASPEFEALMGGPAAGTPGGVPTLALTSPYARKQYGTAYTRSAMHHVSSLASRQTKLIMRDKPFLGARIGGAIMVGLILGSLFYKAERFDLKMGLFLFSIIHIAFSSSTEVPIIFDSRFVAYKQMGSGMYEPGLYLLSIVLTSIPLMLAEVSVFSVIIYTLADLSHHAGRFFVLAAMMLLVDAAMSAFFRVVAFGSAKLETGQALSPQAVSLQVVFAGYLITYKKIPNWLVEFFWVSPFSWALRAIARTEANDPQYVDNGSDSLVLGAFEIQTEQEWVWAAAIFILGFTVLLTLLTVRIIRRVRFDRSIGTSRVKKQSGEEEVTEPVAAAAPALADAPSTPAAATAAAEEGDASASAAVVVAVPPPLPPAGGASVQSTLPFVPLSLAFRNIRYTVTLPRKLGRVERTLLQDVCGFALPGESTYLQGASGAGKTTLLDCLAGRKNAGRLEGEIYIGGKRIRDFGYARTVGFSEQSDLHAPFLTVRESLMFSAALRLPGSVPHAVKARFVEEVMDTLELTPIADRLVGYSEDGGISKSQAKRLTVGVELCSNPSIIFADEPTTALDSRAAAAVMRVLKRVAKSGRTCISTIHQPSETVFRMSDRLLLLQRGGYTAFFGETNPAPDAAPGTPLPVVDFLSACPGVRPIPEGMNPGSWMLDVLMSACAAAETAAPAAAAAEKPAEGEAAAATEATVVVAEAAVPTSTTPAGALRAAVPGTNVPAFYLASPLAAANAARLKELIGEAPDAPAPAPEVIETTAGVEAQTAAPAEPAAPPAAPRSLIKLSGASGGFTRSFAVQLWELVKRTWLSHNRNRPYNLTRIAVMISLALIFGALYFNVPSDDFAGIRSKISVIFLSVSFCGIITYGTQLAVLERDRAVVYRERAGRMYRSYAYSIAPILVEIPWCFLVSMLHVAILYFMVGFKNDAGVFFHFWTIHSLVCLVMSCVAQWFIAGFPSLAVAAASAGVILTLWFLLAGLFSPAPSIPLGWKWLYVANPLSYALNALVTNAFHCNPATEPSGVCPTAVMDPRVGPAPTYEQIIGYFGLDYDRRNADIGFLLLFVLGLAGCVILSHRFLVWVKR